MAKKGRHQPVYVSYCERALASAAISHKTGGETPHSVRGDIKGFTSLQASAASAAISRKTGGETPHSVRGDIKGFTSLRASASERGNLPQSLGGGRAENIHLHCTKRRAVQVLLTLGMPSTS